MSAKNQIDKIYEIDKIINRSVEKKVIAFLKKNQNKKLTVTNIYKGIKSKQSRTSQALALFRKYHIVIVKKDWKYRYYSLNQAQLKRIEQTIQMLTAEIDYIIDDLKDPTNLKDFAHVEALQE